MAGVGGEGRENCAGSCRLRWGWFARGEDGEDGSEEGLVMKARGEGMGGQVDGDHVPFNLEKRRERKEDEPEMRLNFNEGKFSAK